MGLQKSYLESLEYSLDYDGDEAAATFTPLDTEKVFQGEGALFREQPVSKDNFNTMPLQVGVQTPYSFLYVVDDEDVSVNALKAAANDGERVHWRVKSIGQVRRIVGGDIGCSVLVAEDAHGQAEDFAYYTISGKTVAPTAGGTFDKTAPAPAG